MGEHASHGPIAAWDREGPYGSPPGFGFIEKDDGLPPSYPDEVVDNTPEERQRPLELEQQGEQP